MNLFAPLQKTFIFTVLSLAFSLVLRLLLITHVNENFDHLISITLEGILNDWIFVTYSSLIVFILLWLFSLINERFANIMLYFFYSILGIIAITLNTYYQTTNLLLGADLWGYSVDEIILTVKGTNASLNWELYVAFFALIILPILVSKYLISLPPTSAWVYGSTVLGLLALSFFPRLEEKTESEINFERNKVVYLIAESFRNKAAPVALNPNKMPEYPLLHEFGTSSTLAPFFNFYSLPSIVLIMVEGLGDDYIECDAKWGGYMPFLDSLTKASLYWPNTFSSAGRTFNALPSICGSLPFSPKGFMDLGPKYPKHNSLITYLSKYEYTTNYYYGGNINFDKQDIFLEHQKVDFILNEYRFSNSDLINSLNAKNSWGFNDRVTFDEAASMFENKNHPEFDIYMTLTTHEPFKCPDDQLAANIAKDIQENHPSYIKYSSIFSCLNFTDRAIKKLIEDYSKRPGFENTLFIITGDHRLIPMPMENSIERFKVPLILWSPALKRPLKSMAVNSHLDITPSILKLILSIKQYKLENKVAFIGSDLDTSTTFSAKKTFPILINKNDMNALVHNNQFLYKGTAFTFDASFKEVAEAKTKPLLTTLDSFKQLFNYVIDMDRITNYSINNTNIDSSLILNFAEINFIESYNIDRYRQDAKLKIGQRLAFKSRFKEARAVLKHLLHESPNYTDARVLIGRTYSWTGEYEKANIYFKESIRRSPDYEDPYIAYITNYKYAGNKKGMDSIIAIARKEFPNSEIYKNF